ncbi:lipoprotein ABC transporter ATP-binding protein [Amycolatopsis regifaucium]|uniref:Lipoprotein ABC transporter ATP-binding protein n=2 Tax=Amycolatopsis regifaucium TaxID=546365 RepID=A0A154M879_9PSEU|nr:lipoprotein ABC transporter ATP-binding protein [Amycolatopsis regifaucium]OKA09602.1 lipoprotein ABC transporter ATP-binding protein [Amycolatopsis regifaucium]SFH66199.1 putative ABC transport system ATP-binding protein [Amycolatopsis regifaucium]
MAGPGPGSVPLVRLAVPGDCVAVLPAGGGEAPAGGRGVGVLLRRGNLFGHLTVEQNVVLAGRLAARRAPEKAPENAAVLLELAGLAGRGDAYPGTLSALEGARAGVAVALAGVPDVLFADEPAGELDRLAALELMDLLCAVARRGTAVVVATRDPDIAAAAHRIVRVA